MAAGREGIVYPVSNVTLFSQKRFDVSILSSEEPVGTPPSAKYVLKNIVVHSTPYDWTHTEDPPVTVSTLKVYPVNGTYAHVNAHWTFPGGAWAYVLDGYHIMYLAASKANQGYFDLLLFDKQDYWFRMEPGSGVFSEDEVFKEGDTISLRQNCPNWACNLKVEKLYPNGTLVLRYQFWKKGYIKIDGANYEFVLSCSDPGALGTYNAMNIDLNADRRFDGENEGPYTTGDSIQISGRIFDIAINPFGMYVDFISPSARTISSQIVNFCRKSSLSPKYLAIMGFPDSIPYAVMRDPKTSFLAPHVMEDFIPTDLEYGRIENQDFPSTLTGRIFAESVFEASSLVARTLSYPILKHMGVDWNRKALIIGTMTCDQLQVSMYLHLNNNFKNLNYTVTESTTLQDLKDKSIIYINAHGTPYSIALGNLNLDANTNWEIRTPALVILDSCDIGKFSSDVNVKSYLLNVFFRKGAVAVLAPTYLSWVMGTPSFYNAFLNAVLYQNSSLGEALMRAQEYTHIRAYSEPEDLRQMLEREQAYLSITLYGDPALIIGSYSPKAKPARLVMNGNQITVQPPEILWDLINRGGFAAWDKEGAIERSGPGLILETDKNRNAFLCAVEGNFTYVYCNDEPIQIYRRRVGSKVRTIWLINDLPLFCPPTWFESGWGGEWSKGIGGTLPRVYHLKKRVSSIFCSFSSSTVILGESITVSGSISPPQVVTVTLTYKRPDGSTFNRTVNSGPEGSYSDSYIPDMVGQWEVKASWLGNNVYEGAESNTTLLLVKMASSITCNLSNSSITFGEEVTISGYIYPQVSSTVSILYSVDGTMWSILTSIVSGKDGSYSYSWSNIPAGSYYIKASWSGNDIYQEAESNMVSLKVAKASSTINLQATKTTLNKDDAISVSGFINPPLPLLNIVITYEKPDGTKVNHTVQTKSDGSFSDSINADLTGNWKVYAFWQGNENYNGAISNTITVTVSQLETLFMAITVFAIVIATLIILFLRRKQQSGK